MILKNLEHAFQSNLKLNNFIDNEIIELTDLINFNNFRELYEKKDDVYKIIASNELNIHKLNISEKSIRFIYLLLEISQRLGHRSNFIFLYKIIIENGYNPGYRLKAASLYYEFGADSYKLINNFNDIHDNLQNALNEEDDLEILVFICFIDYFTFLLTHFNDFNKTIINKFFELVSLTKETTQSSFLHSAVIKDILNTPLSHTKNAIILIHEKLNKFKNDLTSNYIVSEDNKIESELLSEYTNLILTQNNINFNTFLSCSKQLYKKNKSQDIWESLKRGTKIIDHPLQLLAYMYSFGEMHSEKIFSAFEFLDNIDNIHNLNIYDWGCGQAVGTICFCDYLSSIKSLHKINDIHLIEPSILSLQRAGFNLTNYLNQSHIKLINKRIGDLSINDFSNISNTKFHFFSNILDVEAFSIRELVDFIKTNFKGINYFICTSPKFPFPKNYRFELFIDEFKKDFSFKLLGSISQGKKEWKTEKNWTRLITVFKSEF